MQLKQEVLYGINYTASTFQFSSKGQIIFPYMQAFYYILSQL
jgi:hypothetical protein